MGGIVSHVMKSNIPGAGIWRPRKGCQVSLTIIYFFLKWTSGSRFMFIDLLHFACLFYRAGLVWVELACGFSGTVVGKGVEVKGVSVGGVFLLLVYVVLFLISYKGRRRRRRRRTVPLRVTSGSACRKTIDGCCETCRGYSTECRVTALTPRCARCIVRDCKCGGRRRVAGTLRRVMVRNCRGCITSFKRNFALFRAVGRTESFATRRLATLGRRVGANCNESFPVTRTGRLDVSIVISTGDAARGNAMRTSRTTNQVRVAVITTGLSSGG